MKPPHTTPASRSLRLALCVACAICVSMAAVSEPQRYEYVEPTSRRFALPSSERLSVVARRWSKHRLDTIKAAIVPICPLASLSGDAISPNEKGVRLDLPNRTDPVYLCSNYWDADHPKGLVENADLYHLRDLLTRKDRNEIILRYSLVNGNGKSFHALTGYDLLQPARFSREYAIPGEAECCEMDTPDRIVSAPLRLVAASPHRCDATSTGLLLELPRFGGGPPQRYILCPDQARSAREELEIGMDVQSALWELSQFDDREIMITHRTYDERRADRVRTVERITGLDILPVANLETRLRARMAGSITRAPVPAPSPPAGTCRPLRGDIITRIRCNRASRAELPARLSSSGPRHRPVDPQ